VVLLFIKGVFVEIFDQIFELLVVLENFCELGFVKEKIVDIWGVELFLRGDALFDVFFDFWKQNSVFGRENLCENDEKGHHINS
jgi:hypothetical protein